MLCFFKLVVEQLEHKMKYFAANNRLHAAMMLHWLTLQPAAGNAGILPNLHWSGKTRKDVLIDMPDANSIRSIREHGLDSTNKSKFAISNDFLREMILEMCLIAHAYLATVSSYMKQNAVENGGDRRVVTQADIPNTCSTLELKSYQVVGVNWLLLLYENKVSGVLADDIGPWKDGPNDFVLATVEIV
ncbi:hypothetical protein PsorP6_005411 [Peronosclerospora sorghi]|uniref:Uncharacterized protein n=1 Tax=Peronosclerospora sorghi TaxID=230839 RepID=A0ACC0W2B0_9STRA|nr:hypothetical protein PsorP6_005411 [Peronosclerospora sorghi]